MNIKEVKENIKNEGYKVWWPKKWDYLEWIRIYKWNKNIFETMLY